LTALLLDTHIWAWSLAGSALPAKVQQAIEGAEAIWVSPISFFEIGQKVRLGKWPAMAPYVADLPNILRQQGGFIATLTPDICLAAATLDWQHRDPFDRLLAATCFQQDMALASVDAVFDGLQIKGKPILRIG
jgi:PIN domain nuclease of toxin-antitoxin system